MLTKKEIEAHEDWEPMMSRMWTRTIDPSAIGTRPAELFTL